MRSIHVSNHTFDIFYICAYDQKFCIDGEDKGCFRSMLLEERWPQNFYADPHSEFFKRLKHEDKVRFSVCVCVFVCVCMCVCVS